MSLATVRIAFIDWLKYVTSYDKEHVIWAEQNMPRPTKPYITAHMTSFVQPNHNYVGPPNASGESVVSSDKEFTLGLNCFGTTGVDPIEVLLNLHDSLSVSTPYKILQDAGIAFVTNLLGPSDVSRVVSETMYEERAMMDLLFRIPWTLVDAAQGFIDTVKIDGEVINVDGITILQTTQTVQANP